MIIDRLDPEKKVFIVAEIGNNHEGDFSVAEEMIGHAAESGADAVKFQTFIPEHYVSRTETTRLERLRQFQFSYDQFQQLSKYADELGVRFFSTPFDIQSANFLNTIQPLFKIASGDNTFFPLIETVATFGKPMIVSTGLADLNQLDQLYARIKDIWLQRKVDPGLAFLHCVASYPVPLEQANIGAIATLKERFPSVIIGYSDHTLGIEAATHAVAAGARIIEKHFTLDKNYSQFRDHQLSADPSDFRQLVNAIRQVELMVGSGEKTVQACEKDLEVSMRRSIAAATDLTTGTILTSAHLTWVRPGTALSPGEEASLMGRTLRRSLAQGELISLEDVT